MIITIRNAKESDKDTLFDMRQNIALQHMLMAYPEARTTKPPSEWLQCRLANENDLFQVVSIKTTDQCIGFIQMMNIHNIARHGYFAIAIHPDYQNMGYGKKALSHLICIAKNRHKLYKLILNVLASNSPAIHLYTKFGFEAVGVYKKHYLLKEFRHDVLIMEKIL